MFSGLTNQVSNWMGKKAEDGSELPAEPDKRQQQAGDAGGREVSGGLVDERLAERRHSRAEPRRLQQAADPTAAEPATRDPAAASTEHVKDDDASRWVAGATGGADSGPASLAGTPTEDKDGQQAFGAVSTKALAGAKSLGGFLYSAVNKAGKSVAEASAKIKKTVEEN
ncbi:hypothetical protein TSAR_008336, partial [Trichomalopsis sarcophagae]